jgi:phage shock protein A|nr:MAG TPA: PspA/IM30 family [Caudoviricetes sp.]
MIFKKIWQTIKKVLSFLSHRVDKSIPVEDQLEIMKKDLLQKKHDIENNSNLMQIRGMKQQYEQELKDLRREFANANFDKTIKFLKDNNDTEHALETLKKKKRLESKIEATKDRLKQAKEADRNIVKKLNLLDAKIQATTDKIEELKERNQYAEQTNAIADLMNQLNDIDTGVDVDGISDRIKSIERESNGRLDEFNRRSSGEIARQESLDNALLEELNNY